MKLSLLQEPEIDTSAMDGAGRLHAHRAVLTRKPMLRTVFREFHQVFTGLDQRYFGATAGIRLELGAGISPVRETAPEVLATDLLAAPHLDRVIDACRMDLEDESVRALYGQNCFHHFPDPEAFLAEARRVLAPGGGVILIEPYYGPLAAMIFKRLFATETFDKGQADWKSTSAAAMSGANQALSHIVFCRDRARFQDLFPDLEVVHARPLTNYPRYLLSGGLNFRQLVPDFLTAPLKGLEWVLTPLAPILALHWVVVVRRAR